MLLSLKINESTEFQPNRIGRKVLVDFVPILCFAYKFCQARVYVRAFMTVKKQLKKVWPDNAYALQNEINGESSVSVQSVWLVHDKLTINDFISFSISFGGQIRWVKHYKSLVFDLLLTNSWEIGVSWENLINSRK